MMDNAKAVIAFDANVGLKDITEEANNVPSAARLTATGRYAHIPADGFLTNTGVVPTTANTAT